ncbi:nicotinate-nucleotide--dimethylbenzimidazole phosphoribosyltransferase [Streptomyces sp. SID685]|uniref:nicotinate-nucleotide--dimethylbenzimidazole phosphoribosyltransferase n=1 Tax=Streptomyces sp. SID685 TaxID=2690322 RepID=UPI001369179B|nr:nicotinate-nucleotide--dimethylbenzimidazole phosphoribosyltransferase [Streptomyces sp. SID685]MYR88191.1 nicotinate-nucleotide--dimethylbenzimidazole phosphoribosyltransferase [Streptomyces sp. SID685]
MTDTGQVPGEGQPESAGMVEQPGVTAHGAYTYLSEAPAEDEDLLLPGAQGAWGNEVPPPAPEPVVETLHEASGHDTGSVDLGGVRLPSAQETSAPRRPLHLGPLIPDASAGPVRSLADRGPEYLDAQPLREMGPQSAAPWGAAPAGTAVAAPVIGQVPGVAETAPDAAQAPGVAETGQVAVQVIGVPVAAVEAVPVPAEAPEQVADVAADAEAPGVAPDAVVVVPEVPGAEAEPVAAEAPQAPVAETVDPALVGTPEAAGEIAAQVTAVPAPEQVVQDHDGPRPVDSSDGVPAPQVPQGPEVSQQVVAEGAESVPVPDAPVVEVAEAAVPAQPVQEARAVEATAPAEGAPQAAAPVQAEAQVPGAAAPVAEAVQPVAVESVAVEPVQVTEPVEAVAVPVPDVQQVPEAVAPGVEAAQQAEQAEPVTAEAVEAVQVIEPVEPVAVEAVAVEPVQVLQPVEPLAPEAAQSAQPVEPVAVPVEQAQPVEAVEVAAVPAPDAQQVQAPQPVEPVVQEAPAVPGVPQQPEPQSQAQAQPVAQAAPVAEPVPVGDPAVPAPQQPADVTPAPVAAVAADPQADVVTVAAEAEQPQAVAEPAPVAPAAPEQPQAVPAPVEAPMPAPVEMPAEDPAQQSPVPAEGLVPTDAPVQPAPAEQLPGALPEPAPEPPLGEFVPVEGQVPSAPHLAPTPPHPLVLPAQGPASGPTVPAPREAEVLPHAETLPHAEAPEPVAEQGETPAEEAPAPAPTGPAAPGYDDAEREAVLKVMRERRDIRNGFRSDPIPHEVLLRVLEAAHTAPSVGHSQPWDFVVIRSADTRNTMHELAMRQREAYAKSLPKGRAKQFKELKIEAILDTPVNIVVTADPTRGGRHTLGRYTQPQMAPYSAALAVENLWLAARAEGLGVGWVSFFDEREMVRALGLPEHLEVIAYLCVGYVDEFPDEPELMQAGWSKRRPLSWVVHEETYGRRALPGEEPHDLLAETVAQIRPLDAKALGEAWERQKRMTKPAGALGMLEIISAQLSGLSRQCPPPIPEPAAVAIFAGDHGVHAQGVTPWPQEVTGQMVANFLGGGAVCNAFAAQVGAEVCVVDVGVATDLPATPGLLPRKIRGGTSDMTAGPAMSREEAKAAIEVGIETARDLVAAGNKALLTGEMGIANTTASAALISVFTGTDPAEVTGRGTGINDETLARKTEVVRRALDLHQPDPADPIGVLAALGGFEHAAMVGLLLGGASLRTPVILDGVSAGAAALVARAIAPEVLAACIAGHRSAEPGHVAALNKLGLRPLVDLDLRLGEGTGALLALPLVQSAARAMHEVATFDSAGVTEK